MGFAERLFKRAPAPKATVEPTPAASVPYGTAEELGSTPEEVAFFKSGEASVKRDEAELARREEIKKFNEREAKIKSAEEAKKNQEAA